MQRRHQWLAGLLMAGSIACGASPDAMRVFRGGGLYPVGHDPYGVAFGDLNGDELPDIAVCGGSGGKWIGVLFNEGNGTFACAREVPVAAASLTAIAAIDMDGDAPTTPRMCGRTVGHAGGAPEAQGTQGPPRCAPRAHL